jgi:Tfp pilus assembly protein PilO
MAGPGQPPAPGGGAPKAAPGGIAAKFKLTKQQQQNLIVGLVISVGVGYVYYNYFFTPNLKLINSKSAALEQKKKDLEDARSMVSKYDEFAKKATEINEKTDFINRRLPMDTSISDTIKEITEKATACNINILGFTPGKTLAKDDYKETELVITFHTTYKDLGDFLTGIGYIERLTTPSKISIKNYTGTGAVRETVNVEMTIKIYSFVNKG